MDWSAQQAKYGALVQPTQPSQQPPPSQGVHGRGGFLSSLISELGGAGGAAGGAAIGTALLPGVGTLIGAGLGGLIGGTGGKAIEQKVRDNQNFLGAGGSAKSALTEGGVDSALSVAGEAASGIKAAKAAGQPLSSIFSKSPQELKALTEGGGNTLLQNAGNAVKSSGTGALDTKLGINAIPTQAERMATTQQYGIKSGLRGLKQTSGLVNGLEAQITPMLQNVQVPVDDVFNAIDHSLSTTVNPVGKNGATLAENLKNVVLNNSDGNNIGADALRNIRGTLSDAFTKNTTTPITGLQQDMYHSLNDVLGNAAPDAKALISEQSKLFNVAKGLSGQATGASVHIPFVGNAMGKSQVAGVVRDTGKDIASGALNKAGNLSAKFAGPSAGDSFLSQLLKGTAQNAKFQAPASVARAVGGAGSLPQEGGVLGAQTDQGITPQNPNDVSGLGGAFQPPQPTQSQYPISQALADIARDPKNASTYLAVNKAADAAAAAQDQQNTTGAAQQKSVYGAQNALQALDNIQKQFASAGGGQGALAGRIANLGTKVNLNSNLTAYNSKKTDAALQLAVGLFGATAGRSPQIISKIRDSLPDAQDSPAVANAKIEGLRQSILATYQDAALYGQTGGQAPTQAYDPTQNSPAYLQQQQSALTGGF